MISIIAAITADRAAIGRRGDLLFHISADLRHFKQLTSGHTVVMGRKTFESLPKGALPDRRNIVVTRNAAWSAPGVETAASVEEAMALASQTDSTSEPEIFIIGGGQLYAAALPLAGRMDLTIVDEPTPSDADTFFPEIDPDQWQISELGEPQTDERSGVRFRFITFARNKRLSKNFYTISKNDLRRWAMLQKSLTL